ncbi:hypothetical protein [Neisseria dumasiana]|uniref:hypothetical protein n=1 Tax=Neisseria dumasiana TaxID=1931275 RepID=UPI000A18C7EB|nr:hypothetical protein [Neisseria dumasiana]OSI14120.1 hypothetical protein BV914_10870 [Neisseria dumasiana]
MKAYALKILALAVLFSGCSSQSVDYVSTAATPNYTESSLDKSLDCVGREFEEFTKTSPRVSLFIVSNVIDGTVRQQALHSPLADAGAFHLKTRIHALFPYTLAKVVKEEPLIFQAVNGPVGINAFGLVNTNYLKAYQDGNLSSINFIRNQAGLSPASYLQLIPIEAAFTRNDQEDFFNRGRGANASQSRARIQGNIDYGSSSSSKIISLAVNVNDPSTNTIAYATSFDLKYSAKRKEFSIQLTGKEPGIGYSFSSGQVESVQSAQQVLLDAASLWVADLAYPELQLQKKCSPKKS